jgi:hypothetical protein
MHQTDIEHLITIISHPRGAGGVLEDEEVARGAVILPLGTTTPIRFTEDDWKAGIISCKGSEIRIVAIMAKRQRDGAFTRLLASIAGAGLKPVVIAPMGPVMIALMHRWRWVKTVKGKGYHACEEWRPPYA